MVPDEIAGPPGDMCPNRIAIGSLTHQLHAEPVPALARHVTEEQWRSIVHCDQHIHCAIVVVISNRQATRCKLLCEHWSCLLAYVLVASARHGSRMSEQ